MHVVVNDESVEDQASFNTRNNPDQLAAENELLPIEAEAHEAQHTIVQGSDATETVVNDDGTYTDTGNLKSDKDRKTEQDARDAGTKARNQLEKKMK